jgi:hypothetical protein
MVHQSKALYDVVSTTEMRVDQLERKLESINKTYGLAWFIGRDGQHHAGIDQQPLLTS